jgi:ATP-dependent DNA helicase RecG
MLPGVGPARARALGGMGIETLYDLLRHFPRDYDDRSQIKTVAMLAEGAVNTIRGFIAGEPENIAFPSKKGGKPLVMTKARLRDETGELALVWFNQPYLKTYFKKDTEYIFTGRVKQAPFRDTKQMESPDYAVSDKAYLSGGCIIPLYTTVKSLSQKIFRSYIHAALTQCREPWPDDLPGQFMRHQHGCSQHPLPRK